VSDPPPEVPVDRPTSRLIVIDDADRILLFRATAEGTPPAYWFTPGGGVEPGETYEQAAHRELWEETGVENAELGPCLWTLDAVRRLSPTRYYHLHSRYYLVRTPHFDPEPAVYQPDEEYMLDDGWFRWWTLDELHAHQGPEVVLPDRLPQLLPPILEGRFPNPPVDLSS